MSSATARGNVLSNGIEPNVAPTIHSPSVATQDRVAFNTERTERRALRYQYCNGHGRLRIIERCNILKML